MLPILRRLASKPTFTLTAAITLALGIAANTSVFSVIDRLLLQPLPYDEPDRLVALWHTAPGLGFEQVNQSAALDQMYQDAATTLERVGMWTLRRGSLTGGDEPREVPMVMMSADLLPTLRVDAALGRRFLPEDDNPDSPQRIMISHDFWQRHFASDPSAVGRNLRLNGSSREIIGVLPEDFEFLDHEFDIALPMPIDRTNLRVGQFNFQGIGRLAPDTTLEQANAELDRLIPLATERFPGGLSTQILEEAQFAAALVPLGDDLVGGISGTLWILFAAVGLVLAIAAANVANLFLVRAESRRREFAVRRALGASRLSIARDQITESTVLALLGGALAVPISIALLSLLRALEPETLPKVGEMILTPGALVVAFTLSVLTGLAMGLLTAMRPRSERAESSDLREAGRSGGFGGARNRSRALLVITQFAIGLVLLVGSGLLLRSYAELRSVDPGFDDPDTVFTFRIGVPHAEVPESAEVAQLLRVVQEDLAALPGVEAVGATSSLPTDDFNSNDALLVEEFPTAPGSLPPVRRYKFVTPGYFDAIGTSLLAGRDYTWQDLDQRLPVAVVTADFANELWGSATGALGKRIADGVPDSGEANWREIIGVVEPFHDDGPDQATVPIIFWPSSMRGFWGDEQYQQRNLAFAMRTERAQQVGFLAQVEQVVWRSNRNLPLSNVQTLGDLYSASMARAEFAMIMLLLAACTALLIGAVGIYGVLSYVVAQRRREFGVRLALGATVRQLRLLVLRYGLQLAIAGIAIGVAVSVAASRLLRSLLYGVTVFDPLTLTAVSLLLVSVTVLVTLLAGRRAARIEPTEALRAD